MFPVGVASTSHNRNVSSGGGYGFSSGTKKVIAAAMSDREFGGASRNAKDELCKVRIEFTVHDIPDRPQGETKSFLDFLYLDEQHDVVHLQEAIRAKLRQIDLEGVDFEILTSGSSRFVVDETYFQELLSNALRQHKQGSARGGLATLGGSSSHHQSSSEPEKWLFDVNIKKKKLTLESLSVASGSGDLLQRTLQLTAANLANHHSNPHMNIAAVGGGRSGRIPPSSAAAAALSAIVSDRSGLPAVPIANLNATLVRGKWRLECRVRTVKKKTDNIVECEVADIYLSHQTVSLVTYNRACVDRLVNIRPNTCIQLWNVQCSTKTSRDQQFSTNGHPMKLIYDEGSELAFIEDPIITPNFVDGSVHAIGMTSSRALYPTTVAAPQQPLTPTTFGNTLSGSSFSGARPQQQDFDTASTVASMAGTMRTGINSLATTANTLNSTTSSATYAMPPATVPRRTLLVFKSAAAPPAAPTSAPAPPPPLPPQRQQQPVAEVGSAVVDARDDYLQHRIATDDVAAERLKKKLRSEVTDKCFICLQDLSDDADFAALCNRLQKFRRKVPMPTPETVKALMTDRRVMIPNFEEDRIYCKTTFVDTVTKRLHRVHARCAHLCTQYQKGDDLSAVVAMTFMNTCDLCGEEGACLACTNPECEEWYHTTCAIFSNGYVNFDIRDPYLPRPACPRHTNPNPSSNRSIRLEWVPNSGTEAFDSACVRLGDLRDPDDDEECL